MGVNCTLYAYYKNIIYQLLFCNKRNLVKKIMELGVDFHKILKGTTILFSDLV